MPADVAAVMSERIILSTSIVKGVLGRFHSRCSVSLLVFYSTDGITASR